MKFATELDRVNPKFSKNHIYLLYSNLCFVYSLCRAQTEMLSEVVSGLVSNRTRVELEESSIFLIFKMVTLIFLFLFVANFLPPLRFKFKFSFLRGERACLLHRKEKREKVYSTASICVPSPLA